MEQSEIIETLVAKSQQLYGIGLDYRGGGNGFILANALREMSIELNRLAGIIETEQEKTFQAWNNVLSDDYEDTDA